MNEEKEIKEKTKKKIRCSKCGSTFGYLRMRDKVWCCRSCGFQDKEVIV